MATLTPVENDIVKKVARCLCVPQKRFGCIARVGWSNSDSDFEKNDTKAINTKRLSLSFASDSKCFKRAKTKEIAGAKKSYPPVNMKQNTNWAVKAFQTWWGWHNSTAEEKDEMCPEDAQTTTFLPISISTELSVLDKLSSATYRKSQPTCLCMRELLVCCDITLINGCIKHQREIHALVPFSLHIQMQRA